MQGRSNAWSIKSWQQGRGATHVRAAAPSSRTSSPASAPHASCRAAAAATAAARRCRATTCLMICLMICRRGVEQAQVCSVRALHAGQTVLVPHRVKVGQPAVGALLCHHTREVACGQGWWWGGWRGGWVGWVWVGVGGWCGGRLAAKQHQRPCSNGVGSGAARCRVWSIDGRASHTPLACHREKKRGVVGG